MRAYVASVVPIFALALAAPAHAAGPQWSTTELQLQLGELNTPQFAGGGDQWTFIITGQHASRLVIRGLLHLRRRAERWRVRRD